MTSEADAIPFEPAVLRGERLLVLAPHPDDEAIACGGLVIQHLLERRLVRVLVATDGGQAGDTNRRQAESRRGLEILGGGDIEFLGFADRGLDADRPALAAKLAAAIREWKPDLILAPSPIEIHPDHLALATALCELVQHDATLFAELADARVAFYEVGQPLRPNAIVDITAVAATKFEAIAAHASQLEVRDYVSFARGLNAYRAMTMPREVEFAEAYFVLPLPELRTTALGALQGMVGNPRMIVTETPALPISVVVRTKNRPALLREAIASIRAGGYPCEIVVVNDGGTRVEIEGVRLVEHETSRGRSEAANAGVRAAKNPYVAFLDDDDLHYPEHLPTLARAAVDDHHTAWYSEAVSAFVTSGESGALETTSRLRLFSGDFDRDALLADNYIPLPTVLLRRDDFLELGGFDAEFDLFEDWDFLIRLSERGAFVHVPRITCEIRHIDTAGSITMEMPEGSAAFREAKLKIWRKHSALVTQNVLANALERQKRLVNTLRSESVEARGLVSHLDHEIARLQRESLFARENEVRHRRTAEIAGEELTRVVEESGRKAVEAAMQIAALRQEKADVGQLLDESQTTVQALYAEIRRLQGLLDSIYASNTWKLHTLVEKVKGRG